MLIQWALRLRFENAFPFAKIPKVLDRRGTGKKSWVRPKIFFRFLILFRRIPVGLSVTSRMVLVLIL